MTGVLPNPVDRSQRPLLDHSDAEGRGELVENTVVEHVENSRRKLQGKFLHITGESRILHFMTPKLHKIVN